MLQRYYIEIIFWKKNPMRNWKFKKESFEHWKSIMQICLIIFCSCLSSAYCTYNFSHVSHSESSHDVKKQCKYVDWMGLVFPAPENGEHFNSTSHRQPSVPTLTTAVTQGMLPWIALGRGTVVAHRVSHLAGWLLQILVFFIIQLLLLQP